jgi:hypothetical protein
MYSKSLLSHDNHRIWMGGKRNLSGDLAMSARGGRGLVRDDQAHSADYQPMDLTGWSGLSAEILRLSLAGL